MPHYFIQDKPVIAYIKAKTFIIATEDNIK